VSISLAARLGLGPRELVAFVGAGGKSTLLFALGEELAAAGRRVVLTTTTKLGAGQAAGAPTLCRTVDPTVVAGALAGPGPVMVVAGGDDHKVTGPAPAAVNRLFEAAGADYVLVEADGARRRAFKAPAAHEPVIPGAATVVVVVMGADAIGGVIADVCHRPEIVAGVTGRAVGDDLDPEACARVLVDPRGGLKGVPASARTIVAITKVTPERAASAAEVERLLVASGKVERVVVLAASACTR
jgi:molybdenum cofactor cytidylyltransferase